MSQIGSPHGHVPRPIPSGQPSVGNTAPNPRTGGAGGGARGGGRPGGNVSSQRSGNTRSTAGARQTQESARLQAGGFEGEFLPPPSLDEISEEASLFMAGKIENKHHTERKLKPDRPAESRRSEDIVELLRQTRDPDAESRLEALAGELLKNRQAPTQQARDAFGDVSQQYLALQYALKKGEREGADPERLESLRDALADLEIESGPWIRAGINALGNAGAFATDAQGVQSFQDTYRDVVLGENTLSETLALALERFGGKHAERGLKQMILTLGADLSSTQPSTSTSRLRALTRDLYLLEVAVTALDGCAELSVGLRARGLGEPDDERLMRDLVGITGEKWLAEGRFTTLAERHGVTSIEGRVAFLTGVKNVMKAFPEQVFPTVDDKQATVTAIQTALNTAIEAEEDRQ
ncbi:type III secretion system gatekeeper subunit SctW [Castellaniella sp. WN]